VTTSRLDLTREQIVAYRQSVNALNERLPPGPTSLRRAAWAGLQDSMPRAAVLSIHARVEGTGPATWEDESLVQQWGPRFSAYVVAARDLAVFSLGRLQDDARGRRTAEDLARRLSAFPRRPTDDLQGAGREILVPDPDRRRELWTSRVWPGAVLVEGDIVGTWRRAQAESMPLPRIRQPVRVRWDD